MKIFCDLFPAFPDLPRRLPTIGISRTPFLTNIIWTKSGFSSKLFVIPYRFFFLLHCVPRHLPLRWTVPNKRLQIAVVATALWDAAKWSMMQNRFWTTLGMWQKVVGTSFGSLYLISSTTLFPAWTVKKHSKNKKHQTDRGKVAIGCMLPNIFGPNAVQCHARKLSLRMWSLHQNP